MGGWGQGSGDQGLRFKVYGLGCRVEGLRFGVCLRFRVWGGRGDGEHWEGGRGDGTENYIYIQEHKKYK